jgi:PAS domain S-box-containing protein
VLSLVQIPFSGKQVWRTIGPVKRATASRLGKAGIAIPVATGSLGVSGQPGGAASAAHDSVERRNAEQALREQKYALDQHAIVATTDVQGTITYVNDKFCAISKYTRDELLGQNHRILNSGHHRKEFFQQMYHTIANGGVWHGEICNRAKDGWIYWVDTTIVPFAGEDGKPRQYVAIRADITERKRAEEALRESLGTSKIALKELADQKFALDQHAIVATTDVQGTITYVNDKFCAISKYSRQELVGQNHRILNSGHHSKEFFQQMYHTIANGQVWRNEICNRAKDGSIYWVDTTVVPFLDAYGKPRQYMAIRADITERKQAERAVKESLATSEAALKELADQNFALDQHAIVATTDVQGTITYVNDKFCTISKYSKEELIGQNHRILNSGHHPKEFFQQMYHTIARGQVWRGEICNRAKDGSIYWVDTTVVPFVGAEGKPRQYVAIRADITERKRVEEALREQAQILDSAQVFVRDIESRVLFWPRGAEKLYGFTSQEALGTLSHDLFHTEFPEPLEMIEQKLFEAGIWEGELIHRKRDGSTIVVSSAWVLHRNSQGQPIRILETNIDITARKQAEEEVQKLNDELEKRVIQRTAQLEAANHELEAFTYSVSHDLRAPLRHIGGFSKILIEDFGPAMAPEARTHLERIQDGTRRMGLLVDELLNLARVGRHALNLQPTNLNLVIEEVVSLLQPEAEGRVVDWKIGKLPAAECDPILIKQVFQNLLANALKFTRHREHAVIEINQGQENGPTVIVVRDNGVGFNMKYSDKLFGVFQRLHRAEDFEGTGIGLATVKRIIYKHGGRVWAEAELDKGATFYFTLQAEPTRVTSEEAKPIGVKASEGEDKSAAAGGQS